MNIQKRDTKRENTIMLWKVEAIACNCEASFFLLLSLFWKYIKHPKKIIYFNSSRSNWKATITCLSYFFCSSFFFNPSSFINVITGDVKIICYQCLWCLLDCRFIYFFLIYTTCIYVYISVADGADDDET